jgi:hypothetical protein
MSTIASTGGVRAGTGTTATGASVRARRGRTRSPLSGRSCFVGSGRSCWARSGRFRWARSGRSGPACEGRAVAASAAGTDPPAGPPAVMGSSSATPWCRSGAGWLRSARSGRSRALSGRARSDGTGPAGAGAVTRAGGDGSTVARSTVVRSAVVRSTATGVGSPAPPVSRSSRCRGAIQASAATSRLAASRRGPRPVVARRSRRSCLSSSNRVGSNPGAGEVAGVRSVAVTARRWSRRRGSAVGLRRSMGRVAIALMANFGTGPGGSCPEPSGSGGFRGRGSTGRGSGRGASDPAGDGRPCHTSGCG